MNILELSTRLNFSNTKRLYLEGDIGIIEISWKKFLNGFQMLTKGRYMFVVFAFSFNKLWFIHFIKKVIYTKEKEKKKRHILVWHGKKIEKMDGSMDVV